MNTNYLCNMATYTQIKSEIEDDVCENVKCRFEVGFTYDEFENECEEHIQYHYNTHPLTKYECIAIVGNNLQIYLEMEEKVNEYWNETMGEDYTKSGLVNIVPLWKYIIVQEWKQEELETLYEELAPNPLAIQQ